MMKSSLQFLLLAGVLSMAFLTGEARAVLVSYEGFNYPTGTFATGADPGASWAGDWTVSGTTTVVGTGSLAHPLGSANTTGNRIQHTGNGSVAGMSHTLAYGAGFQYDMQQEGTVRYASALVSKSGTSAGTGEYIQLSLGFANGSPTWLFGMSSGETFFLRSRDTAEQTSFAPGTHVTANTSYLLVSKLVTSASGTDTIYLNWYSGLNAPPLEEPTSWMFQMSVDNTSALNQTFLRVETGNASGTTFSVDEIRLGTSWLGVVPEPGRALLMLLGGTVSMMMRRRRVD